MSMYSSGNNVKSIVRTTWRMYIYMLLKVYKNHFIQDVQVAVLTVYHCLVYGRNAIDWGLGIVFYNLLF